MNKYLALAILLLVSGTANAHSHPAVDALTHALEHAAMAFGVWLPYLSAAGLAALLAALFYIRRRAR
jgi:hypothetical protein